MEFFKIVLLGLIAAVVYGILHDLVTAQFCVEYFTIGHPLLFPTRSPILLALGWGVVATWWVGLPLGLLLAMTARAGFLPKLSAVDVLRPVGWLMACTGLLALLSGCTGFLLSQSGMVWMLEPLASRVPQHRHSFYLADAWAHVASYAFGALGAVIVCIGVLIRRWRLELARSPESLEDGPQRNDRSE